MNDAAKYISKFIGESEDMKNKNNIICICLLIDRGRILHDKEIELLQNNVKVKIPIFLSLVEITKKFP